MVATKLTAYIDEAGTHDGSVHTVMAGWVGSAGRWEEFERKWKALLQSNGLTHMHAKDLTQGTRQFKDRSRWPEHRRLELAQVAGQLAHDHALFSLSVLLRNSDYDAHYLGADRKLRRQRAAIDSKYGVCARIFISMMAELVERYGGANSQVTLIFENGHKKQLGVETVGLGAPAECR